VSTALALRLIASGAVSAADAEAALLSSLVRRVPFVRALIDTGAIGEAVLDQELEHLGGIGLRQVTGMPELVNRLPPHFCRRMGVLPVRVDHAARTVEVAAADPLDTHIAAEVGFHLGVPVRVLRAPMSAIEDAIRRIELEAEAAAGRARRATPPFPHGAPESSNPPPPPPEPAPIPLVRRIGTAEKAPDTPRLYKQTLRPGTDAVAPPPELPPPASEPEASPARTARMWDLRDPEPAPRAPVTPAPQTPPSPVAEPAPRALRDSARLRDLAQRGADEPPASAPRPSERGGIEPVPRTLRDSARLRDAAQTAAAVESARSLRESQRLRDLAQQITSPEPRRSPRDSTPRLRDFVERPPPVERLRDSTPRLRDLAQGLPGAPPSAPAETLDGPLVAAADQAPPAEPPAVSFPSLPPPSVMEEPALLAADEDWSSALPAASPPPEPTPQRQRRPSRFARPAIDIQIPQPPSERRARRQRTIWEVPLEDDRDESPAPPAAEPAEPPRSNELPPRSNDLPIPAAVLDTSAVLQALRGAASRDDVVIAALRGLRTVGRRTAIFVVRRDGFHGWSCNVELGDQDKLRRVFVPGDAPSLFATAVATGTYFGPVPNNAAHATLLGLLEQPASDVAVAIARAGGKPVMVLFADDLVDVKRRVLPRLIELADAVGAALSRLLAARL
jgi:hypothetical protein